MTCLSTGASCWSPCSPCSSSLLSMDLAGRLLLRWRSDKELSVMSRSRTAANVTRERRNSRSCSCVAKNASISKLNHCSTVP